MNSSDLAQRGWPDCYRKPDRLAAFVAEALAMPRPLGKVKTGGAETQRILSRRWPGAAGPAPGSGPRQAPLSANLFCGLCTMFTKG
jgi:hypothetical protein